MGEWPYRAHVPVPQNAQGENASIVRGRASIVAGHGE